MKDIFVIVEEISRGISKIRIEGMRFYGTEIVDKVTEIWWQNGYWFLAWTESNGRSDLEFGTQLDFPIHKIPPFVFNDLPSDLKKWEKWRFTRKQLLVPRDTQDLVISSHSIKQRMKAIEL